MRIWICVLSGLTLGVLAAAPAHAASCLRMRVTATGATMMWHHKAQAKNSAIAAWRVAARKQAGAAYDSWALARGKSVTCALVSKSTIKCTAVATPCRP